MTKTKGFIVYHTYRVIDGKAYVYLYGKLENGESFLTINEFKPYFFIKKSDEKKAKKHIGFRIEDSDYKDFKKEKLVKVVLTNPKEVPALRRLLQNDGVACYESDIRFVVRFLIDHGIYASMEIEGEYEKDEHVNRIYKEPKLRKGEFKGKLSTLSFDIETNMNTTEVLSVALYSETVKKVIISSQEKLNNALNVEDEKQLLEKFVEYVKKIDPDIITGWNVIDFDLKVLRERMKHHGIKFNIGRGSEEIRIRTYDDFFRESDANIIGRMVLDGIGLMKGAFIRLPDYKLNTAAQHFLGKEKLITSVDRRKEIERLYQEDKQRLVDYNYDDAKLVIDILDKADLIELTILRSALTGMTLDRVSASIASLDSLYLREIKKLGFVAYSLAGSEREERIKGGFVMQSIPGIYDYILVLDFKSLYPSIIRTFNIDPLSYIDVDDLSEYKNKEKYIITPNGAVFENIIGVLPDIIQKLWQQRDAAKKRKDKIASFAIKILMNSMFGVLANPNCRFYSIKMANAITHTGQHLIKLSAKKIEEKGYKVIYGDTDSVFIKCNAENHIEAVKIGEELQKFTNEFFKEYIKKEYHTDSFLEIEFEKVFKKFLMPQIRHSEVGSKKRYAGLIVNEDDKVHDDKESERIDITGLEYVRRDWTELAKKFQYTLLDMIFHDKGVEDIVKYIKGFVDDLKKGKKDDLLIVRKAITKPLSFYTKTTPPHVKAARKLEKLDSNIIDYYMTINGPEPIQFREMKKSSEIDYQYYMSKQLEPIADTILVFFQTTFDDILKGSKQKSIFDY